MATQEPLEVDLTWLLRRPFCFLPPVTYRDQCQLFPTALGELQDQASIPARVGYEAQWGVNYVLGSGLPLDWFDRDQQRHISAHRMDNIPTMTILAHRSSHRNTVLDTTCLLCGAQPETAPHLWACSAQSHKWRSACRRLADRLDRKVGSRGVCATSYGSRLFWNSGRQRCVPPPCSGPTWSALGPIHWGLSSYATSSRSPSESGTPTPRRVPRC